MKQIPAQTGKKQLLDFLEKNRNSWPFAFRISYAEHWGTVWQAAVILEISKTGTVRILAERDHLQLLKRPNLPTYMVWKGPYSDFISALGSSKANTHTGIALIRQFLELQQDKFECDSLLVAITYIDFDLRTVWVKNNAKPEYIIKRTNKPAKQENMPTQPKLL